MTENNSAFLRFLPPLDTFEGGDETYKAEEWISSVKRLKQLASMNDKIIIAIAASNMSKKAKTWWGIVEDQTSTWKDFEEKFTNKLMKNRIIEAWKKIKTIKLQEHQECSEIIDTLNPSFKTANLTNDESKISFFIASIKPAVAYELARDSSALRTYEEVTNKAVKIEKLQMKYNPNLNTTDKKVHFDIGRIDLHPVDSPAKTSNSVQNGSEISDGRISTDSLSELIAAVNKLNINLVQHGRTNQAHRPSPVPEKRPLMCWNCNQPGHPADCVPHHQERASVDLRDDTDVQNKTNTLHPQVSSSQQENNSQSQVNIAEITKPHNSTHEVDIYAVKRKDRSGSSRDAQAVNPGKRLNTYVGTSSTAVQPSLSQRAKIPMTPRLQQNQLNPNHTIIQSQSPQPDLSDPNYGQDTVRKVIDKGRRPRRQQKRLEVEVLIESTWDKLS
ncbi:hypothetical protein A0J61_10749, partial [Choanephora cucurbitarum]